MANMSYCRWQNTNMDLSDCARSMNERAMEDPYEWEELSREEKSARRHLFSTMLEMMQELGLEVPSHYDLENALDNLEQSEEDAARERAELED